MAVPLCFLRLSNKKVRLVSSLLACRRCSATSTPVSNEEQMNTKEYRCFKNQTLRHNRGNPKLEKKARLNKLYVPLGEVEREWLGAGRRERGMQQLEAAGLYSHVFQDVFGGDSFYPHGFLNVSYSVSHRVTWGDVIPAKATLLPPPMVTLPRHIKGNYVSLLLTGPDTHLRDISSPSSQELLHWMVINIPLEGGHGDIKDGYPLAPYLPPIPLRGTGFHRYVFALYTHTRPLPSDSTHFCMSEVEGDLTQRIFSSAHFCEGMKEDMKPWSFSFFQSQWDKSVSTTYQSTLKCPEPLYGPPVTLTRYQSKNMEIRKSRQACYNDL